jgi:hypothetical protein
MKVLQFIGLNVRSSQKYVEGLSRIKKELGIEFSSFFMGG